MGFTSGKGESRLAVKLEELETRLGEVQANLKELSDAFGDFQEHRIQDLDERYVQAHTCAIVQKMVTDKIAMLPALLMADEQFRNMIRQEVRNGMNAAIAHDVRRQS